MGNSSREMTMAGGSGEALWPEDAAGWDGPAPVEARKPGSYGSTGKLATFSSCRASCSPAFFWLHPAARSPIGAC